MSAQFNVDSGRLMVTEEVEIGLLIEVVPPTCLWLLPVLSIVDDDVVSISFWEGAAPFFLSSNKSNDDLESVLLTFFGTPSLDVHPELAGAASQSNEKIC